MFNKIVRIQLITMAGKTKAGKTKAGKTNNKASNPPPPLAEL